MILLYDVLTTIEMVITLCIFAPHHGHSVCDGGFAHRENAVHQWPKKGHRPPRDGEALMTVIETIQKHTAELMEEDNDLSFTRVKTMAGIQSHYCFRFFRGNVVVMYKLASDEKPFQAFRVTNLTAADGARKVVKVNPRVFV